MADFHEDLIQKLPRQSAEKVRALTEAKDLAYGGLRLAMAAAEDCRNRLQQAETNATHNIQQLPNTRSPDLVNSALAPIAKVKAELERAKAAEERAKAAWEKFHFLGALRDWSSKHFASGGQLAYDPLPPTKLAKGETPRQALERIRAEINQVEAAWNEAQRAPMPLAEIKAEIAATVDAIAACGAPSINPSIRDGDPAKINLALQLEAHNGRKLGDGGASFFVWLMRDQLVDKLNAQADALQIDGALSDAEREKLFSDLADRRLELERVEESIIVSAAREGMALDRRLNADPRAVLEVVETFDGDLS